MTGQEYLSITFIFILLCLTSVHSLICDTIYDQLLTDFFFCSLLLIDVRTQHVALELNDKPIGQLATVVTDKDL